MGLAEEGDRLTHVRLTEWGRFFIDGKKGVFPGLPAFAEESAVRILPSREIIQLTALYGLADPSGPRSLTLTRESLQRWMDAGRSPSDAALFLEKIAGAPLPDTVRVFIQDMGKKHGQVRLGRAVGFLQTQDPLVLEELKSVKSLSPFLGRELGPTAVLLTEENLDKVARHLKKLGHMPVVEDDDDPFLNV